MYRSENSIYNAQDRFNFGLGVRHDLTGKISLSSTLGYTYSFYDGSYSAFAGAPDAKDNFLTFNLRGSYQINRNNFIDAGYQYSTRDADQIGFVINDWDRNVIDIGWRLRL